MPFRIPADYAALAVDEDEPTAADLTAYIAWLEGELKVAQAALAVIRAAGDGDPSPAT